MAEETTRYSVDIPGIINMLGGNTELQRRYVKTFGGYISMKTIAQWKQRNSMPLQRFLDVMKIADKLGKRITINRGRKQ